MIEKASHLCMLRHNIAVLVSLTLLNFSHVHQTCYGSGKHVITFSPIQNDCALFILPNIINNLTIIR